MEGVDTIHRAWVRRGGEVALEGDYQVALKGLVNERGGSSGLANLITGTRGKIDTLVGLLCDLVTLMVLYRGEFVAAETCGETKG